MPTDVQKAQRIVPAPTFHISQGPLAGTVIRLGDDEGLLGRREDNTYVITDPGVSRVHARVTKESGSIIVTDLGSSAGTRVNGQDITGPQVVNHGDQVSFGPVTCVFQDPAASRVPEDVTMVYEVPKIDMGPSLSPRQQEVLELMAEGMTNKEIGDQLGITERTVKAYAQELYDKLGARNRAGAVAEGAKLGLL
ncbi:MAG TPA: LuxR C-terminal-related transcriptional regulator [Nitriliruptorales bacterium]